MDMCGISMGDVAYWSFILSITIGPTIIAPLLVFLFGLIPKGAPFSITDNKEMVSCCGTVTIFSLFWIPIIAISLIVIPFILTMYASAKAGNRVSEKIRSDAKMWLYTTLKDAE